MSKVVEVPGVGNVEFPDNMSDGRIANVIKKQYGPQMASGPRPQAAAAAEPAAPSMLDKVGAFAQKTADALNPVNISQGIVKGAVDTAYNIAKPTMNYVQGRPADAERGNAVEEFVKPQNAGESVGKFVERGAEFAGGDAAVRAGMDAVPLLARGTGLLARMTKGAVAGGASGAGVTAAQGGSLKEVGINAALGAGLAPVLEATGEGVKFLGKKFQARIIGGKNSATTPEILDEFGLSGMSLKGTLDNVHNKIVDLATQLRNTTKSSPAAIDLGDVLAKTESDLLSRSGRLSNAGDVGGLKTAMDKFLDEAADLGIGQTSGKVTIDEAQTLKRAVGLKGAWENGRQNADTALEQVANTYYKNLKDSIEKLTPPGKVAAINQQLAKLMPIEQDIIKRLPVKARSAPLSLSDLVVLTSGHPIGTAAHVVSKTMAGAKGVIQTGKAMAAGARPATAAAQAAVTEANQ